MSKTNEQHIPDGEWEGFYIYATPDVKHNMSCFFTFKDGSITGKGTDDVGNYSWKGSYDEGLKVTMTKSYPTHAVSYSGYADENGIWGNWKISTSSGGFHLWPISQKSSDESTETEHSIVDEIIDAVLVEKISDAKK